MTSASFAVFLIGPSNAGKSTTARELMTRGVATHVDLDAVLFDGVARAEHVRVAQDWSLVRPALDELEARPGTTVVDIGAGTQDMDRWRASQLRPPVLQPWLEARRERVVLLTGDPNVLYGRSKAHEGNRPRFDKLEFGPARRRLYAIAAHVVDGSDKHLDGVVDEVVELIREISAA